MIDQWFILKKSIDEKTQMIKVDYSERLIRCKDCKYWLSPPHGEYGLCDIMHDALKAKKRNGYCDEAKRREE